MTKLSIGLDLDGVVANWNKGFRRAFIERADVPEPLSVEQLRTLDDPELIVHWDTVHDVVGEKNWKWFWSVAVPTGRVVARQPAMRPNVSQAATLCEAHGVFVITTRPSAIRNETYEWIGKYGLKPEAVIHVDHKVKRSHGGGQDKAALINALDLVAMLEDNADTAEEVAQKTSAMSFLLDQPWNRDLASPWEVHRVFSVAEYQAKVEELYG